MANKTIGQIDLGTIADGAEFLEMEQSGVSKKATVQNVVYGGMPVGMMVMSEFDEATSAAWPAVPRNADIDITPAQYPLLATKLYDVKASILGTSDFDGSIASASTYLSIFTFTAATAATALCSLLVEDAQVSRWMNLGQDATAPSVVDFVTSSTSRCINIGGTDYPIYPSTAASAISVTSGTVIFEGKPSAGSSIAAVYTYRIPGTTTVRLRKIAGFVGVAAGDAGGEVVGGFRRMDRGQGLEGSAKLWAGTTTPTGVFTTSATAGTRANGSSNSDTLVEFDSANSVSTKYGNARTGKTTDPRTAGQYVYTWAGVYTP